MNQHPDKMPAPQVVVLPTLPERPPQGDLLFTSEHCRKSDTGPALAALTVQQRSITGAMAASQTASHSTAYNSNHFTRLLYSVDGKF